MALWHKSPKQIGSLAILSIFVYCHSWKYSWSNKFINDDVTDRTSIRITLHNDAIIGKYFPRLFVRGIRQWPMDSLTKANNTELCNFFLLFARRIRRTNSPVFRWFEMQWGSYDVIIMGFCDSCLIPAHKRPTVTCLQGAFYEHGLTLITAWITNDIHYKMWDKIIWPFPNFNGCTVEVWEWTSNFIPHLTMYAITYPWWSVLSASENPLAYWLEY